MSQGQKPALIKDIKLACKITGETLEESSSSNIFKVQLGITLLPQGSLTKKQAATFLRKFGQSLGSLKEDMLGLLTLNLEVDSPEAHELATNAEEALVTARKHMKVMQKDSDDIIEIAQKRLNGIMQDRVDSALAKASATKTEGKSNDKTKPIPAASESKKVSEASKS